MIVNLTNVQADAPNEWLRPEKNADGSFKKIKYTLKVTSIEADGYDDQGDERYKMTFKTADGKMTSDSFTVCEAGKTTWKLKRITVAMKAPDRLNLSDLIGRYVVATIGGYTSKANGKDYAQIESFEYSPHNDKLAPIPEAKTKEEQIADEAEELF